VISAPGDDVLYVVFAVFAVEAGVIPDNAFRRDAVFEAFEEELMGVQVYPVGQLWTIGVQVYPVGQATSAKVGIGAKTAIVMTNVGRIERIEYFLMIFLDNYYND
jgi:hypothetical protein